MTSPGTWGDRVAQNFNVAASGYNSIAGVQSRIAGSFARWIADYVGDDFIDDGLEIGCGTGFLSGKILERWPDANWLLTDIAGEMVRNCEQSLAGTGLQAQFSIADGQSIDLPTNSLDLIVSNMTFQWFSDLPGSSRRLMEFLRPGGKLIFSTLGWGTFRSARQYIESAFYDYPDPAQLKAELRSADTQCQVESHTFSESTRNLGSLLRHLSSMGAGTPVPGHCVTPSQLRRAIRESAAEQNDLDVEYEVLFVAMQKC